jgi:hypothetical protein
LSSNFPDFSYWLDGIVSACELISSPNAFERVWVFGDTSITSIHYPDELFEQLLGDLHLEESLQDFADHLREMAAFDAIAGFARALVDLERVIKSNPLGAPEELLRSREQPSKVPQNESLIYRRWRAEDDSHPLRNRGKFRRVSGTGCRNFLGAHSKTGASLASTSSMIALGTLSSFLPPRAARSSARG